nr:MAG TPA: hypothetical protein [Caudoviricetes sp.]
MERLMLEDMIKALKCVGSQNSLGDCYADREDYMHMEDENYKRLVCGTGKDLYIKGTPTEGCPYYQKKYGVCPEDGDLYWLNEVAELLEELKSYKGAEEQGLLMRLPCPIGTTTWDICGMDIRENVVSGIEYCKDGKWFLWANEDEWLGELGELVFFTREEAEKKLEEMKNDKT